MPAKSSSLASNLALAWTDPEDIGEREPDAIQSGGVGPLNLIWTPREKLSTGIELIWGMRENADGDDGDATRVQTMVMYTLIIGATLRMRFEVTSTT